MKALKACNFIKKILQHRCFHLNIAKLIRAAFLAVSTKLRFTERTFEKWPKNRLQHSTCSDYSELYYSEETCYSKDTPAEKPSLSLTTVQKLSRQVTKGI